MGDHEEPCFPPHFIEHLAATSLCLHRQVMLQRVCVDWYHQLWDILAEPSQVPPLRMPRLLHGGTQVLREVSTGQCRSTFASQPVRLRQRAGFADALLCAQLVSSIPEIRRIGAKRGEQTMFESVRSVDAVPFRSLRDERTSAGACHRLGFHLSLTRHY